MCAAGSHSPFPDALPCTQHAAGWSMQTLLLLRVAPARAAGWLHPAIHCRSHHQDDQGARSPKYSASDACSCLHALLLCNGACAGSCSPGHSGCTWVCRTMAGPAASLRHPPPQVWVALDRCNFWANCGLRSRLGQMGQEAWRLLRFYEAREPDLDRERPTWTACRVHHRPHFHQYATPCLPAAAYEAGFREHFFAIAGGRATLGKVAVTCTEPGCGSKSM